MVKRRKNSTTEKGSKESQQNGASENGNVEDKDGGVGATRSAAPELRRRGGEGKPGGRDGEKAENPAPPPVRTSSRVPKRPRRDNTPPPSPPKKSAKGEAKSAAASGTPEAKTRRQWELWSSVDKDLFFEALNEHGKDFEAIQSVIAQRHRKRGNQSIIRTKEQIRHFYYRTWHKIVKFVEVKEDVGKHAMELYGLINYGELRKRVGGLLNEKSGQKLNELVQKGVTVVKTKGKNCRVRTPVCRALKKLNNIEESKEEEQVVIPKQLTLELRPASNAAWTTVQTISHNPRLRIHLPSNKRLSAVIEFLNKKWKSHRLRLKESMKATEEMTQELRLTPPSTCELYPFDVTPISSAPTVNLALEKFKDSSKDTGKNDGTRSPAAKRVKRNTVSEEHHSEDSAHSVEDVSAAASQPTELTDNSEKTVSSDPKNAALSTQGESVKSVAEGSQPEVPSDKSVPGGTKEAGQSQSESVGNVNSAPEKDPAKDSAGKGAEGEKKTAEEEKKEQEEALRKERIELLRQGWNLKSAEGLTIGELYLLLGCPEKLTLEYDWVDLVKNDNIMQMNLALTNMLRRLVQLATTEFSDFSKTKPPMIGLDSSSPQKTCTCGVLATTPSRGKNCRTSGGSTPKGSNKPGAGNTQKTATQSIGTQVPDQSDMSLGNSQVLGGGSAGDGVFRVPNPVPVRQQVVRISPNSLAERNLLQQIELHKQHKDILMPRRQRKQVMRNVRRAPLVVQRTLLPKTGVPTRQIMTFTMLPNQSPVAQTGSFLPVIPGQPIAPGVQTSTVITKPVIPVMTTAVPATSTASASVVTPSDTVTAANPTVHISSPAQLLLSGSAVVGKEVRSNSLLSQAASAAGITPADISESSQSSLGPDSTSPNLSSILDISLPSVESNDGATNDSFISAMGNATFSGLLDTDTTMPERVTVDVNEDSMSLPSAATSPNKSFRLNSSLGPDAQWMNGDDFSLSQFLSDSPLKKSSNDPSLVSECSRDSIRIDVDTALQSMMNENSMEYSSKFADLAAQIAANAPDIAASRLKKT